MIINADELGSMALIRLDFILQPAVVLSLPVSNFSVMFVTDKNVRDIAWGKF